MTLAQMTQVKRWLRLHGDHHSAELYAWDLVLTAWVLGWMAVPVMLLGAVSPWAVRLGVERVEDAGRVVGRLYALSTAGSLFGTLASALLSSSSSANCRPGVSMPSMRIVAGPSSPWTTVIRYRASAWSP